MTYEFLEHTADVKFRAEGSTIEEMFVAAAGALNETVRGDITILEQVEKSFGVVANDKESLLYDFLEEFLFLLDAENFVVSKIKSLEVEGNKLKCVVVGDDADNYKFTNDVKAVTYSEMSVKQVLRDDGGQMAEGKTSDGRWVCEVVLDV